MGLKVTAAEAAQLVDRHERIVRWHLKRGTLSAEKQGRAWAIDTDDLGRIPGWKVDRDRLAQLEQRESRTAESLAMQIAALRRELDTLRSRVRALELSQGIGQSSNGERSQTRLDGQEGVLSREDASYSPSAYQPLESRPGASFSLTYAAPATPGTFRTRADAGRWLARHGVNEHTPKTWRSWQEVPLEPRPILEDAISRYDPGNWRITWRLRRCGDPSCVCAGALPD